MERKRRLDEIDDFKGFTSQLANFNVNIDNSLPLKNEYGPSINIDMPSIPEFDFNISIPNNATVNNKNINNAISTARSMLGKKYKWGAKVDDNSGADCSSLTSKAARSIGLNIPRTAYSQYLWFKKRGKLTKDINSAKAGDFVYFNFTNRNRNPIGHTAIISEVRNGKIKIIEASGSRGKVIERWLPKSYYNRIAGIGVV